MEAHRRRAGKRNIGDKLTRRIKIKATQNRLRFEIIIAPSRPPDWQT
jgi:hypothetical protein